MLPAPMDRVKKRFLLTFPVFLYMIKYLELSVLSIQSLDFLFFPQATSDQQRATIYGGFEWADLKQT